MDERDVIGAVICLLVIGSVIAGVICMYYADVTCLDGGRHEWQVWVPTNTTDDDGLQIYKRECLKCNRPQRRTF